MTDFRAEAIEAYETTRSSDTRGIIAALLHVAETIAPADTGIPRGGSSPSWQAAALSYLQGGQHRAKTVDRLARWLTEQGFDVDDDAVGLGMWELVEAGRAKANTTGAQPLFSAVPDRQ
ncbi:hypothetical protein OG728_22000 [Streptomyces microflavus]|uniref:hypothetical protein n=1 Tax=Streptomyces griseus group TaxID=629295 RepID=UPI002E0D5F17|nr:hypothetical protein OG728_22000 [Streptomyces microflavus]WTD10788.1 hypothetical protein OHA54_16745 [Streptomyces anulatus]WTE04095.1 hypothetical protein OH765_16845 [Streptomyces anulatus]